MSPLLPALIALFLGSAGVPIAFKELMIHVPKFNSIWAILHPIHGLVIYSLILIAIRPARVKCHFSPSYALPIAALFGLYNVMKGTCGKGVAVPGIIVHLTDQLEPLVVMFLSVAAGCHSKFSSRQWAAAALLLVASVWYILQDTTTALDVKSPFQLGICVAKNVPLGAAFMYIEWVLAVRFPDLFPTVLWWWICALQTFTTLVPAYYQFDPKASDHPDFFAFVKDGTACYWFGRPESECAGKPMLNAVGVLFGAIMNLAMPVVTRHGGAPLLMMVRAVTLPFVAFLFTCPSLVGKQAETLDSQKVMGLACATVAMMMWASGAKASHGHAD